MKETVAQINKQPQHNTVSSSEVKVSIVNEPVFNRILFTPALTKLLEALVRAVNNHRYITVVTGKQGSGKSELYRLFAQQVSSDRNLCALQARHVIGERHIIVQLNKAFFPNENFGLDVLVSQMMQQSLKSYTLLIDDAHKLSPFALNLLIDLQVTMNNRGGALGIVLFAHPKMERELSTLSIKLKSDVIRIIDMPALTHQQAEDYIHLLIANYPHQQGLNLSASQVHTIIRQGEGNPASIRGLVLSLLSKQDRQIQQGEKKSLKTWLPNSKVIYMAVIVVLAGSVIYTIIGNYDRSLDSVAQVDDDISNHPLNERQALTPTIPVDKPVVTKIIEQRPLPAEKKPRPIEVTKIVNHQTGKQGDKLIAPSEPSIVTPVKIKPVNPKPVKPKLVQTKTVQKTQSIKQANIDSSRDGQPLAEKPGVKKAAKAFVVKAPAVHAGDLSEEQSWMLAQEDQRFTIQLAAAPTRTEIERFIKRQPLLPGLHYVHTLRRDRDWYVAVYGVFDTLAAAKSAESALPPSMTRNKPWIRRIEVIKSKIATHSAQTSGVAGDAAQDSTDVKKTKL